MYKISSDIVLCAEFATKYMRRYFCAYYWSKLGLGQGEAFRLDEETLPNSCLVNLIDVTLACEDGSSELVGVVRDAFKNVLAEFVR